MLNRLINELKKLENPEKAQILQKFFKTGKGEYGEGDIFLGLTMPQQRSIAKKYSELGLKEIQKLLKDKIHEHRMMGVILLTDKYKKGYLKTKIPSKEIFDFYLNNAKYINNWDLVDLSAPYIVGDFLSNMDYGEDYEPILINLARSENLWERRISIISTYAFIRKNNFKLTLKISEMLLGDSHDLIHKAVGWMLREVGKKDERVLENFLKKNYKKIPRITLRYSIEKFPEEKRKGYLKGEI